MTPLGHGPLAGEWTPARLLALASASAVEPLAATLNELGRLDDVYVELGKVADGIFRGGARKRDDAWRLASRINAVRAQLQTIRAAAGAGEVRS